MKDNRMLLPNPRPRRKRAATLKRVELVGQVGFRRRWRWSKPFTVIAYRVRRLELGGAR
jgi:hypothetical protein